MKKISTSIPTVIQNLELKNEIKRKSNKKSEDKSSSIVIFQQSIL